MDRKNAWEKYPQGKKREKVFAFAEEYRSFISACKTERECTMSLYQRAVDAGFTDLEELIKGGKKLKAGDKVISSADDLAMYLLEEALVASVSGAAFGAPDCLRFSYATSDEKLIEAMGRVKAAVEKLR